MIFVTEQPLDHKSWNKKPFVGKAPQDNHWLATARLANFLRDHECAAHDRSRAGDRISQ